MNARTAAGLACAGVLAWAPVPAAAAGELNILIWSDYLPSAATVSEFTRSESIHLTYATLDTDDTLQAKLLSGHSGRRLPVIPAT